MKKITTLLVALAIAFSMTGCMNVDVRAPEGKTFKLSEKNLTTPQKSKQVLYVLWGLVPLGNNDTTDMLSDAPNGAEIAVKTEFTPIDFVITLFGSYVSICSNTVSTEVVNK